MGESMIEITNGGVIGAGLEMGVSIPVTDVHHVLAQRGEQYGDFKMMAQVAQELKDTLREAAASGRVAPYQWESLELICTKMARIVCGNPDHEDSWTDIAGYAKLAADHLARPQDESHIAYKEMIKRYDAFST